ncbi:MAG: Gfo/Idh/MocA family oxidoreductase [Planctomyces sp.]|nr:Gfo/Idh/MocA family oxidoreductase [Planctomyces sp.]
MPLTPEQEQVGKENFSTAVSITRRDFLVGAAAAGGSLGAFYFGYKELEGDPVKVAFIGTGDEGGILINEHPSRYFDVVAVADLRPSNLERAFTGDPNNPDVRAGLIRKLGVEKAGKVKRFGSHKELLDNAKELGVEAVIIATPLNTHAPITLDCLDAGLHVLTEKLMARSITECKQMIRKAQEKNLLLAVGHQRHYSVLYENANQLVQSGLLGDIRYIRAQWHRNNSFPNSDQWRNAIPAPDRAAAEELNRKVRDFGFDSLEQLVSWRLYNSTGGGLMAELGSHQLDAASIFLGKVHPLAVSGYGGKNFYGVQGVGSLDKQNDDREIDDHIYVTFEFPGRHYDAETNDRDVCIVTYSSINTNKFEPYGELVYGSRGTLFMKSEKEAQLWKEEGRGSEGGGPDQRLWVVANNQGGAGGAVLQAYETSGGPAKASSSGSALADNVSRGYTEEMEHFAHCIRTANFNSPKDGGLRCPGTVAMADAIMALTANLAMKHRRRVVFKPEWFDPQSEAVPENDPDVVG